MRNYNSKYYQHYKNTPYYKLFVECTNPLALQRTVNELNSTAQLVEDGIIGPHTMKETSKIPFDKLISKLEEIKRADSDFEVLLRSYLAKAEGNRVHWNKGERGFTTPGGIYAYANPYAKSVKYVKSLAKKYKVNIKTRDLWELARLNASMTNKEKTKLWDLVIDDVLKGYEIDGVESIMSPQGRLTVLSISLNVGRRRATKFLKEAFANESMTKEGLERAGGEKVVLSRLLGRTYNYYLTLATYNRKYRIFLKGWINRLKERAVALNIPL